MRDERRGVGRTLHPHRRRSSIAPSKWPHAAVGRAGRVVRSPRTGPARCLAATRVLPEQRGTDSMKVRSFVRHSLFAVSLASLVSCSARTQLTSSWPDPAAPNHQYEKVVVVGATPRSSVRRMYEDTFAADLKARGIDAVTSYSFSGEGQLDKDAAAAKLKEIGADGVIVTRLVDQETVQTYYPPTYTNVAAPSAYYGGWYGYYSMGYSYMSSPGYVA